MSSGSRDSGFQDSMSERSGGSILVDLLLPLVGAWKLLVIGPILVCILAYGVALLIAPTFTARTTFLPPQQQQSTAASALASLGALSSLAGAAGVRTPADQYVALLQSRNVEDRLVESFKLVEVYGAPHATKARELLERKTRIAAGRKDGIITIDVDDVSPQRAADIANAYVVELGRVTAHLALTEAQQRRVLFEGQLRQTRDRLTAAQLQLQSSGFNASTLRAEPKAMAEGYARLRAEVTAAEVRSQALRRTLTDSAPEVQQQLATLSALRSELLRQEAKLEPEASADYIGKYREFKYQETLFELFARQYEMARLDESKEGALIQVIDRAEPPVVRSAPFRTTIALTAAAAAAVVLLLSLLLRHLWRRVAADPANAQLMQELRDARRGARRRAGA
jgi:uncharacterized protein involved in exopolysaccharide biosynthesis